MIGCQSEEGVEPGLGWIKMKVQKFKKGLRLKIPHMGWNDVSFENGSLIQGMDPNPRFYFLHSYYMIPHNKSDIFLTSNYGVDFTAAIKHENIFGVQFHPEKSHRFGKQFFQYFINYK